MTQDLSSIQIQHDLQARRFEMRTDSHRAVLDYVMREKTMTIVHTGVPRELEGRGIGSRLARAALDYAQEQEYRVVPQCSFVRAYIQRHEEYQSLVK